MNKKIDEIGNYLRITNTSTSAVELFRDKTEIRPNDTGDVIKIETLDEKGSFKFFKAYSYLDFKDGENPQFNSHQEFLEFMCVNTGKSSPEVAGNISTQEKQLVLVWKEDFEGYSSGETSFNEITNTGSFNFEVRTGSTPTNGTGANSAFEGSNYIYTEASSKSYGDIFFIETPVLDASTHVYVLEWYYHFFKDDYNTSGLATVDVFDGDEWVTVWAINKSIQNSDSDPWKFAKTSSYMFINTDFKFRFSFSITSSNFIIKNDFCLDNISLYREE